METRARRACSRTGVIWRHRRPILIILVIIYSNNRHHYIWKTQNFNIKAESVDTNDFLQGGNFVHFWSSGRRYKKFTPKVEVIGGV